MIDKLNDAYLVYSFIKRLVAPFTSWKAFKLGVIDSHGNVLIPVKNRTTKQKESLGIFDTMVLNMKKLLAKIPGGSSNFATYSAALFLVKEENEANITEEKFIEFISSLNEEVVNSVGSGHIAGTNKDDATFMGSRVFKVKGEVVDKSRKGRKKYGRYSKYVGNDAMGEEIKNYARKYPKKDIALQDTRTNEIVFLRRRKNNA